MSFEYAYLNEQDIYQKLYTKENLIKYLSFKDQIDDSFYKFIFTEIEDKKDKEFYFNELVEINFPIISLDFKDDCKYYYKKYLNCFLNLTDNIFVLKSLINISEKLTRKINDYIDDNFSLDFKNKKLNLIIDSIIDCGKSHTPVLEKNNTIKEILKYIIYDVFKNEEAKPSEIEIFINNYYY